MVSICNYVEENVIFIDDQIPSKCDIEAIATQKDIVTE